ncbi:sulfatase-like hydrolase/transferase [Seonamhaeicola sp.]|uniref:sulfatase-like hydrolase/transferase n=1 Tax=Seonamhaeicola sp. TaxID=1912245 RepID=UPI00262A445B|nr:sulfatase-like hydrolase/transferase [Seonamhaeicola sp.]
MLKHIITILILILLLGSCSKKEAAVISKKPNILFIISDDHTTKALGVYGERLATLNPTPSLDKLANEGMVFTNCFVNNSICVPSKASILTGQYGQTNKILAPENTLSSDRQYLPMEMKKLGYETALIGHYDFTATPNFDYYNILAHTGNQESSFNPWLTENSPKYSPGTDYMKRKQYKGHSSDVITDLAIDWLKHKRDPHKPFILFHQFKAAENNFDFAPRYKDYLDNSYVPEPASLYHNGNNGSIATRGKNDSLVHLIGTSLSGRNKGDLIWTRTPDTSPTASNTKVQSTDTFIDNEHRHQTYQAYTKNYLRYIKGIDDNVARLLLYLKEAGLDENTIIIYTSDRGIMLGEHDYIDTSWMYEESIRIPFFIKYPEKIKPGLKTDAIVNNTDFAPTIIELAGGATPEYMQGHSFKHILETGEEPKGWQQSTYYRNWTHMTPNHNNPAHFGIRTKKHKLIFFYGKDRTNGNNPKHQQHKDSSKNKTVANTPVAWELYDLKKDPEEMNNIYYNPEYKDIISDLKKQLIAKRKQLNEEDFETFPHIQKIIDQHWND